MMTAAERVAAALSRMENYWITEGVPVVSLLRPGLTDEQIDRIMVPTGLDLPVEARAMFRWHNGTSTAPDHVRQMFYSDWMFLPLEELVEYFYGAWRQFATQEPTDQEYVDQHGTWDSHFPILRTTKWDNTVLIQCAGDPTTYPKPIAHFDEAMGRRWAPTRRSLVSLFETWVLWLETDCIRWDGSEMSWRIGMRHLDWTTYRDGFC